MPYPLLLSSALLRTQRTALPRSFCRYKSITAAIERGRGSGPDRFSSPRPDRFSSPQSGLRDDEDQGSRSRPSRSKSSIGARRRKWDDEDAAPRRKELRKSGAWSDESAVDRRIRDQDRRSSSDTPAFGSRDRDFNRSGRDARPERSDAPRRGRQDFDDDTQRTFDRDERTPRRAREDRDEGERPQRTLEGTFASNDRRSPRNDRDSRSRGPDTKLRGPDSLPYTTAASEFIYGYSSVLAAIRANRRHFYKLYVNRRGLDRNVVFSHARASNLRQITREVGDVYDRAFDKASSGRPHNGFILEASPLPVPPITELKECAREEGKFEVVVGPQTKEELDVNGTRTSYPYNSSSWRYPLILYLDGILDEGNLGAIARSAYFLGVDAIITPTRQIAPWSSIALKASAGAAEAIPIFKVTDSTEFLGSASRNGWRCYATNAIPTPKGRDAVDTTRDTDIVYTQARSDKVLDDHTPVLEHPTILMMGAEGSGLKTSLLKIAHFNVGIRCGRALDEMGVDSLNVSVAAGMLCHDILRRKTVVKRDPENAPLF